MLKWLMEPNLEPNDELTFIPSEPRLSTTTSGSVGGYILSKANAAPLPPISYLSFPSMHPISYPRGRGLSLTKWYRLGCAPLSSQLTQICSDLISRCECEHLVKVDLESSSKSRFC